jgi:hypothetical protein
MLEGWQEHIAHECHLLLRWWEWLVAWDDVVKARVEWYDIRFTCFSLFHWRSTGSDLLWRWREDGPSHHQNEEEDGYDEGEAVLVLHYDCLLGLLFVFVDLEKYHLITRLSMDHYVSFGDSCECER